MFLSRMIRSVMIWGPVGVEDGCTAGAVDVAGGVTVGD
jgi:hypothetical protein